MDEDLLLLILGIVIALIVVAFIIIGLMNMPEGAIENFIANLKFPKRVL